MSGSTEPIASSGATNDDHDHDHVSLGNLSELADGEMRAFADVGTYGIVVCRVDGKLHAIEDNCSHADTPLSEGRLRGAMVVCPLHGAQFDVRDGSHQGPPAWEGVTCYPIEEAADDVTVDLRPPDSGASDPDIGGRFQTR